MHSSIQRSIAPVISESAFADVREGLTEDEVIRLLGQPLGKHEGHPGVVRYYGPPGTWVDEDGLHFPNGSDMFAGGIIRFDVDGKKVVWGQNRAGQSAEEVRAALGEPIQEKIQRSVVYWRYSWSPPDWHYHRRWIGFDAEGRVAEKKSYFYWD